MNDSASDPERAARGLFWPLPLAAFLAGALLISLFGWWRAGAPVCDGISASARVDLGDRGVTLRVPAGWDRFQAGGYLLAGPREPGADERVLVIAHRAATSEAMGKILSPLVGEGAGEFWRLDAPPTPCADAAWAQRKDDAGAWQKIILFRDEGKLELRIESDGGKVRILELVGLIGCPEKRPL